MDMDSLAIRRRFEKMFLNCSSTECNITGNFICNETVIIEKNMEDGSQTWPKSFVISVVCLYGICILIGVGGNLTVLFTIVTGKRLQTVTNFFLASLSVSDILMTIACVPFTVLSNVVFDFWIFGKLMCPLVQYFQLVLVLQRAWTMIAVACDRNFVISKPLRKRLTKSKAKMLIWLLWITAMIVALPIALNSKVMYSSHKPGSKGLCIEVWNYRSKYIYSIAVMLLQYFIPLIIMIVTYCRVGIRIWRKKIPGEPDTERDKRLTSSKQKSVKMLVALVITYAVAWLPLHILTIIGDVNSTVYNYMHVHMIWIFFHFAAVSNGGINPLIYFHMKKSFRVGFKALFKKASRCNRAKYN